MFLDTALPSHALNTQQGVHPRSSLFVVPKISLCIANLPLTASLSLLVHHSASMLVLDAVLLPSPPSPPPPAPPSPGAAAATLPSLCLLATSALAALALGLFARLQ